MIQMPTPTSCPVPEVDGQLSRYVHSQQDTRRIRSSLSKYFAFQTHSAKSQAGYRHLDVECSTGRSIASRKTQGLGGVRLKCLRALEAHANVQARHHKLQEFIVEQRRQQLLVAPSQSKSDHDNDVLRGYVSMLRQRQRFAELQVISDSVEKLLNTNPVDAQHNPKAMVKHSIGEQPDLPAERLDMPQKSEGNSQIFKLKKEVIGARAKMDRASSARKTVRDGPRTTPGLHQQVHALGCARDEIQEWLEVELAKLTEESELLEDTSPIKKLPNGASQLELSSSETRIKASYHQYIASRKNMLGAQATMQQLSEYSTSNLSQSGLQEGSTTTSVAPRSTSLVTSILTHQSNLMQTSRNERILSQQAVHMQSQISAADQEIADSLTRLSQESHLLVSGSKEPGSWSKLAQEAERSTKEVVEAQLRESRSELNNVQGIDHLSSLHGRVMSSMTR